MMPNWNYLHIHNDVIPALKQRGVTEEQLHTMLVDNPRRIFERQGGMSDVPPIGAQISALAALAPDEPAVTCDGVTLTRAELDRSTNRLARAYASLGVGLGDYVTMVLPNSIEWIQAAVACWKLGAVPQPLSARLPDAELGGLLELRPPALLVGRDVSGMPSVPAGFTPDPALSDAGLPEAVSPVWKAMGSGGSTGRPKLIESGGPHFGSRIPAAIGYPLGAQEGDTTLVPIPLSHNTDFTTATIALLMRHHLVVMSRFDPHAVPAVDRRPSRHLPDDGAHDHAAGAAGLSRGPGGLRPVVAAPVLAHGRRRARRPSRRPGSTSSGPKSSGNCTAAPSYRRSPSSPAISG